MIEALKLMMPAKYFEKFLARLEFNFFLKKKLDLKVHRYEKFKLCEDKNKIIGF